MVLQQYKPWPALQYFISGVIVVHYQFDRTRPLPTNPFPPHPEHSLFFYPYDNVTCSDPKDIHAGRLPSSIIVGPKLSRVDLTMGYNTIVVIVNFHPGGLHRLLHIPMNEMLGMTVESSLVLGNEINSIIQQLSETMDFNRMNEIIQQYFLKKTSALKDPHPVEQVLLQMLQQKHFINVDYLAKQAFVSIRQMERQFKERIGIPPKPFLKLVRFSRAWLMRERDPFSSWLHIAHSCGYADQMHMIRDFKFFTDVTPGILQNDLEKTPLRLQAVSL